MFLFGMKIYSGFGSFNKIKKKLGHMTKRRHVIG